MKNSTSEKNDGLWSLGAVAFWLLVWEILALLVGEDLFLPAPTKVLLRLFALVPTRAFWGSILFSTERVALGFLLSVVSGSLLAILSAQWRKFRLLLSPLVKAIRTIPVASIVILTLVWVKSKNLSIVISSLIVFPVVYTNVLEGLLGIGKDMEEMARVYGITGWRKVRYLYLPSVLPYFTASLKTALGLGWKSSVAAEVIGLPRGSLGEMLYESKVYLMIPDLFAWTLVIVLLAFVFEKVVVALVKAFERRILG